MRGRQWQPDSKAAMLGFLQQRLIALHYQLCTAIKAKMEVLVRENTPSRRLGGFQLGLSRLAIPPFDPEIIPECEEIRNLLDAIRDVEMEIYVITVGPLPGRHLGVDFQMGRSGMGSGQRDAVPKTDPAHPLPPTLDNFQIGDTPLGD